MKTKLLILISCMFSVFANAQNADQVLDKITSIYTRSISMKMDLSYYEDADDETPVQNIKGDVKYVGDIYYSKMGELVTLHNNNYVVMVDYTNKLVMLDHRPKESTPNSAMNIGELASNVTKSSLTENSLILEYANTGKLAKAELFYDKSTYLVSKIVFTFKPVRNSDNKLVTPQLVIKYSEVRRDINENDKIFSETNYVKKVNDRWIPAGKCDGYDFINHLAN